MKAETSEIASSSEQIKSLIQQLTQDKKGISKECRLEACEKLQNTLLSAHLIQNNEILWSDLVDELVPMLTSRLNPVVKRSVSNCLGAVGCASFPDYDKFVKRISDAAKASAKYAEDRALILQSIYISINHFGAFTMQSQIKSENIEEVMAVVKQWLEENESTNVLLSLLNICLAVANHFPAVFKKSFDDIVDFTVGWYIEPGQPNEIYDACHVLLTQLRPFWHESIEAALTLMKQFLDDANAYIEDIKKGTAELEQTLDKTSALLRALVTILSILAGSQLNVVVEFVKRMLDCIFQQVKYIAQIFVTNVNGVFGRVIEIMWMSFTIIQRRDPLLTSLHIAHLIIDHPMLDDRTIVKLIGLCEKVVEKMTPDLVIEAMKYMIGDNGVLKIARLESAEVQRAYGQFLSKFLSPRTLPILQFAFSHVRAFILTSVKRLEMQLADESYDYETWKSVESQLALYINSLHNLGVVKNSLIAMIGLTPNLFTFIMTETPITKTWFIIHQPLCHYALLLVIKTHCETHDNFIANSSWLMDKNRRFVGEASTAGYTAMILSTMTRLLTIDDVMWPETRNMVVDWVHSMAFGISADLLHQILQKEEMVLLRSSLLQSFVRHSLPRKSITEAVPKFIEGTLSDSRPASTIRVRHFTLLRRLSVFNLIEDGGPSKIAEFVANIFKKCHEGDQEKVIGIWQAVPPALFISNDLTQYGQDQSEFRQVKTSDVSFTAENFKFIADFLLNSVVPTFGKGGIDDGYWIEDSVKILCALGMGESDMDHDCAAKWRWVLAQMSQFCVETRMKTTFGKPLDTFIAFENEIRRLAVCALSGKPTLEQKENECNDEEVAGTPVKISKNALKTDEEDEEGDEVSREPTKLTDSEQWWRVRALLEVLELLDKAMSFAIDGALFQFISVSQISQQFFFTNQSSCMNWLSRLYLPMMAVAFTNGYFAQVVRIGGSALKDAERRASDRTKIGPDVSGGDDKGTSIDIIDSAAHTCMTWVVRALIELCRPQAIMGVYRWAKNVYDKDCLWIKHASQMANGKIESAIDGLIQCLSDEQMAENNLKTVRQLIMTGLTKIRSSAEMSYTWEIICGLGGCEKVGELPSGFEIEACKSIKKLSTFEDFLSTKKSSMSLPWDMESRFFESELKLIDVAREYNRISRTDMTEITRQLGEDARFLMTFDSSCHAHLRASTLHLLATALKDSIKPSHKKLVGANVFDPSFLFKADHNAPILERINVAQQFAAWISCTQNNIDNLSPSSSSLAIVDDEELFHLRVCKLARRSTNFRLAKRNLYQHGVKRICELNGISAYVSATPSVSMVQNVWAGCGIHWRYEAAKMFWALSEKSDDVSSAHRQAFSLLDDAVADEVDRILFKSNAMMNGAPIVPPSSLAEVISEQLKHIINEASADKAIGTKIEYKYDNTLAKAIIQMADWLQSSEPSLMDIGLSRSMRISWHMFRAEQIHAPSMNISGSVDSLVGTLLSVSCHLAPHMMKAHSALGNWAYKSVMDVADKRLKLNFGPNEVDIIKKEFKSAYSSMDDLSLEAIVRAIASANTFDELVSRCGNVLGAGYSEDSLMKLFTGQSAVSDLYIKARVHLSKTCNCAVRSYFTYISLCGNSECEGAIGAVVATLRILCLLTHHHEDVSQICAVEALRTNELMWKGILPQIFAHLNHPVTAVRDVLCTILERVAVFAPHALCYPAIVGATVTQESEMNGGEGIDEREKTLSNGDSECINGILNDEEVIWKSRGCSLMRECCDRIVTKLRDHFPDLVKDVTDLVMELRTIDMLHEERWTYVLNNLDQEMSRRIGQVEAEKAKTIGNRLLNEKEKREIIKQKTKLLTFTAYQMIESLYVKTCKVEAKTLNVKHFRETYLSSIEKAINGFHENKNDPRKAWSYFKQLLIQLNNRVSKRSLVSFQMAEISPYLAKLSHSHVPIPGQESKLYTDVVSLERCSKQTVVLPTKTRPRKIIFFGSDGKEYPFLYKGHEDLHLDERIMQVLHICNLMLSERQIDWPPYLAKNYSVTPLGSRSGLIEWVDGATPMFQVYRKWQNRQFTRDSSNKEVREVERPSELFFKKLKASFRINKIGDEVLMNRSKWPRSILRAVLRELISETPQNLLAREVWFRSGSADTWFRVTERFARSTAVMSILGSILGLGDRHLDNLLVDLHSGHVIHIDYNICFDKGRNLRVPETVPFRLTGNIKGALGPTQIEGTFRLSCEHVLEKLRENKETLLTILEAFVYDPLVDWTASQDDFCSLFILRIRELSEYLKCNQNSLSQALKNALTAMERKLHKFPQTLKDKTPAKYLKIIGLNICDELSEASQDLKRAVDDHHQIMRHILPLIRSLAKSHTEFKEFLQFYKEFFLEPLMLSQKLLNGLETGYEACIKQLNSVKSEVPRVFENLSDLRVLLDTAVNNSSIPIRMLSDLKLDGEMEQGQNSHGRYVLRRVREKLEGTCMQDSAVKAESLYPNKTTLSYASFPAPEQVDMLIRQATDINNLALMYEGWTAWV